MNINFLLYRCGLNLSKNKIFIFILLTGFILSPLNETICVLSHRHTGVQQNDSFNGVKEFSDINKLNNFTIQNRIDNCDDQGISLFTVNSHNDKNNFYKLFSISSNLISVAAENILETEFTSKSYGNNSPHLIRNSNKLYKINFALLI